jgi:hypothetical protein
MSKLKLLAGALAIAVAGAPLASCSDPVGHGAPGNERWATTENLNVKIDWDKVNEAYKLAEGPADLEKRVNEIYEGEEIISVAVQDLDEKTQVVTGFFDKNSSGTVDEPEKIFTIKRDVTGAGEAQYQTTGHGHYGGYVSPFFSIVSGMVVGSMISSMFMPNYVGVYRQPYVTSPSRAGDLRTQRAGYRAQNPARFAKPSKSGRSYGGTKRSSGGAGRSRGGGRFGISRAGRARPIRLAA